MEIEDFLQIELIQEEELLNFSVWQQFCLEPDKSFVRILVELAGRKARYDYIFDQSVDLNTWLNLIVLTFESALRHLDYQVQKLMPRK